MNNAIGIFNLAGQQIADWFAVDGKNASDNFGIDRAGGRIALAASANEIAIYELATGSLVRRWKGPLGEIREVLLSPDGGTVLAASKEQVIAYAAQTGAELWTQPYLGVVPAFSPDSQTVAICASKEGVDLTIDLLEARTGVVRSALKATADNPIKVTLQFNKAGDALACLGGGELILWNPQTTAKMRTLHFPGETIKLLSPRADVVATLNGSRVRLWDTMAGRLLRSLNGATSAISELAFSADGKLLLSSHPGGRGGSVTVWPVRLGEEITSVRSGSSENRRVLFNHDGSSFYAGAHFGAGSWDVRTGLRLWKFSAEAPNLRDLTLHPEDSSIILSEYGKPTLTHLSASGKPLKAFGAQTLSSLKFNRTGTRILTVDYAFDLVAPGSAFSVLEYPSGKVLRKTFLENPRQPFAAFCLDDLAVATAALAGGITVWDWEANKPLRQIESKLTGSIGCLTASADGRRLATCGPDRWLRVWAAATGRLEAAFRAHWESVRCLKFSPDGRELLSGGEDGAVRIHDATTGEEKLTLYGLPTPVVDVDFSANGALIAAITNDGIIKTWDRKIASAATLLAPFPTANQPPVKRGAAGRADIITSLDANEVKQTGQ